MRDEPYRDIQKKEHITVRLAFSVHVRHNDTEANITHEIGEPNGAARLDLGQQNIV